MYPNVVTYDLKSNANSMIEYISSMQMLSISVYDSNSNKFVGIVNVPLSKYLVRNPNTGGIHTFLSIEHKFPILKPNNTNEMIGEVQIRIEGKANTERPGPQDDLRLANSMARQKQTNGYTGGKYGTQVDYMKTVKDMNDKLSMAKQRANLIMNKEETKVYQAIPQQVDISDELDEVLQRGMKLRERMDAALETKHNTVILPRSEPTWGKLHENIPKKTVGVIDPFGLDFELNDVSDSISDLEIYQKPLPNIKEEDLQNKNIENLPKDSMTIKDLKKASISLLGISFKSEEVKKRLEGIKLYLLTKFPVAEYGSGKVHEEETKTNFSLEKDNSIGVIELNRTHKHQMGITDENFSSLVNSNITIMLMAELNEKNKFHLFGKGELSLQRVMLSPNYKLDTLVQVIYVPPKTEESKLAITTKKKDTKRVERKEVKKMKTIAKDKLQVIQTITNVATVRVIVELVNDFTKEKTVAFPANIIQTKEETISLGLLLYIKIGRTHSIRLRNCDPDRIFRNLYVKYKSFFTSEPMSTNVAWETAAPVFNHTMQYPMLLNAEMISRIGAGVIIFEVWDKRGYQVKTQTILADELIGLAKVPLKSFYEALKSQVVPGTFTTQHIVVNQYPFIAIDDFIPIVNPCLGQSVGSLNVTVAIGTPVQIQRLEDRVVVQEKYKIFTDIPKLQTKVEYRVDEAQQTIPEEHEKEEESPRKLVEEVKEGSVIIEKKKEVPEEKDKEVHIEDQEVNNEEDKVHEANQEVNVVDQEVQVESEELNVEEVKKEIEASPEPKWSEVQDEPERKDEVHKSLEEINAIAKLLNQPKEQEFIKEIEEEYKAPQEEERYEHTLREDTEVIPQEDIKQSEVKEPEVIEELPKLLKHSFTININELSNIPIIARFGSFADSRSLNLFLRANFPFDRTAIESESITQLSEQIYKVNMECSYSMIIPREDSSIEQLAKALQQDIAIEVCALDTSTYLPKVLGIAELPVEDLKLLILKKPELNKQASIERVVFIYGTQVCDREGLIIGKVKFQLKYEVRGTEREVVRRGTRHVWEQEKVVNREIPVKSRLMIYINNIDGIDEGRLTGSLRRTLLPPKEELNLSVHYSLFDQSNEYSTDIVFGSEEPKFKQLWLIDFNVDQKVLEYLDHGSARFEVRHSPNELSGDTFGKSKVDTVVGIAKVPLIKLLSTHAGIINEAVEIKDAYDRCFGYLHLSMNLLDAALPGKEEYKVPVKTLQAVKETIKSTQNYPITEFEVTIESGLRIRNPIDSKS